MDATSDEGVTSVTLTPSGSLISTHKFYKVAVNTSDVLFAGTDANVFVTLIGVRNGVEVKSNQFKLGDSNSFQRGALDTFEIGPVSQEFDSFVAIELGHDGVGVGSGWRCDSVAVWDIAAPTEKHAFPVQGWLDKNQAPHKTNMVISIEGTYSLSQTPPPCFTSNAGDCCPYIAIYATDKIDTFLSFTIKAAVLRVGNLDNADQRIADDLHQFCYTLSDLFARTFKPLLDVVLSTHRMGENMGYRGLLILYAYFLTSGLVIKRISPPFAEYIAKTQRLEGDFRRAHSRLITHAEEVAFLDGARREEQILNSRLQKVTSWTRFYHYLQWKQGVVDQWLVKYLASMIGWPVLAFPFLADKTNRPIAELAALYRESDTLIQRLVFPNHHIPRLIAHTRLTLSC